MPGVSLVVGNSHKHEVADYAVPLTARADSCRLAKSAPLQIRNVIVGDIFAHTELLAAPVFDGDDCWEDAPQSEGAGWLQ